MSWQSSGFWLLLAIVFLAPSISSWLKERERQKTLRASIREDGSIDPEILAYYTRLRADEFAASRKSRWRSMTFEQALAWAVIALSFIGGSTILGVGIAISGIDSLQIDYVTLALTITATFGVWGAGIYIGNNLNKRGGKNDPPSIN